MGDSVGGHVARLNMWSRVPHDEISTCGHGVRPLRLLDMVSAATHTHLVVRRHVDYGRTSRMICWHR